MDGMLYSTEIKSRPLPSFVGSAGAGKGCAAVPTVAISDLEPGAVLSQAIHSPRGVLLAPAGTVVTEAHLALFASWGVREAEIAGDLPTRTGEAAQVSEEEVFAVQQLLDERFSLLDEPTPFMQEVRHAAEQIVVRRLHEQARQGEQGGDGS